MAQDATLHFYLQPSLRPALTVEVNSDWCLPFHLFLLGSQSSLLHSELPEGKSVVLFLRAKQALASSRLSLSAATRLTHLSHSAEVSHRRSSLPPPFHSPLVIQVMSFWWLSPPRHGTHNVVREDPISPGQSGCNTQTKLTKVCPWNYPVWSWKRRSLAS